MKAVPWVAFALAAVAWTSVGCGGCKLEPPSAGPTAAPMENPYGLGRAMSLHVALGVPYDRDGSDDELLVKRQYVLSYNPHRNEANWVAWNLNAGDYGAVKRYRGKFLPDESLPASVRRIHHEDYTGSGYDRGHMVRSEERTATVEDNLATFLLGNILPQTHELNAGPWLALEEECRTLAQRGRKELFLVAGGISGNSGQTIGSGVLVPEAFFKVIVVLERGQSAVDVTPRTRVIAARFPNVHEGLAADWTAYRVTVDELERATGYELLSDVVPAVQQIVEATVDDG